MPVPGLADIEGADLVRKISVPGVFLRAGRIVCANRAAIRLLRADVEDDLVGRDFLDMVHDDAPHLIAARLRSPASDDDSPRPFGAHLRRVAAAPVPVDLSITAFEAGADAGHIVLFPRSDWPDARERVLQALGAEFRPLLDGLGELVVLQDLQGRILLANRAVQEMVGLTESRLKGRSLIEFMPAREHAAVLERAATRLTGSAQAYSYDATVVSATGTEVRTRVSSAPITAEGKAVAVIVVARPVEASPADGVRLARERDDARESNRQKSELLAKVSHELRTPINVIFGLTEMALDQNLPEPARELLDRSIAAASAMLALLDEILDLSRIEAGGMVLAHRAFDLRELLRDALDPMRLLAEPRDLELRLSIDRDVPGRLVGDPDRLRQVVLNLVTNALKFTNRGRVEVRASLAATPTPAAAHLRFAVRDTGVGIPSEERDAIFEPFRQGGPCGRPKAKGVGLGLAIVRELVGLMGGQIWVESELGRGSEFTFTAVFDRAAEVDPTRPI